MFVCILLLLLEIDIFEEVPPWLQLKVLYLELTWLLSSKYFSGGSKLNSLFWMEVLGLF